MALRALLESNHLAKHIVGSCKALDAVCVHLAREMARDGEGATKLVNGDCRRR